MELEATKQLGKQEAELWALSGRESVRGLRTVIRADRQALGALCRRLSRTQDRRAERQLDWLLDNSYLMQDMARQAEQSLRGRERLALLEVPGGVFRVEWIAGRVTELEDFDEEHLRAYLTGVNEVLPLEEAELALLPAVITGALIGALRRAGETLEEGGEPSPAPEALILRLAGLRRLDLSAVMEELSGVDRILRTDPAGAYPRMDEYSRRAYRARVVTLARRAGLTELECARRVEELARTQGEHIGTFLYTRPLGRQAKPLSCGWYLSLLCLLTTALSIAIGFALGRWWAIGLFLLPVSQLVKNTADLLLLHIVPPRPVFRMELKNGLPPEGRTLCVIAALLTGEDGARELCDKLERYHLSNRRSGEQVCYGILADLPDRPGPMGEAEEALLRSTGARLEALSRKYDRQFCLFFRKPVLSVPEGSYRGRERKRGAILALTRYLRGRRGELEVRSGDEDALQTVRFLLVLDSDTVLTMDAVCELAGTMLHPLNTPQVDRRRGIVTSGYGILQPRVETELCGKARNIFTRLFSGIDGLDPYGGAVSELYHDLFDEATFLGKGLLHIDAFLACMDGRLPENRILSHDLLEGSYLRCGWVSRTELLDSFPPGALSWLSRYHRWIRGDWQILDWLGRRVEREDGTKERNPLTPLARWKIFDNLRRSLVPPATLIALLTGLLGTGPLFLSALIAALLTALSEAVTAAVELLWRRGQGSFRRFHSGVYSGFTGSALRAGAELLFLPVEGWTAAHAAGLALWRLKVGHRHLLDWVTSGQSSRDGQGFGKVLRRFWPSLLAGFAAMVWSPYWAGRLLGLGWGVSPVLFWRWGMPPAETGTLSRRDRAFLLHEAALIWRYYLDWLRPEYRYLIPDNVQAMPERGAAERTSPTNIGLALLACVAAADLNLASRAQAVELIRRQLDTLEGLERWHGHYYNWYDITDCTILTPWYVSTVDSGNLCACLIALTGALEELEERSLAKRAAALAAEMDFSMLYDPRRGLFYIGYDAEQGNYSENHYDLMASEARTTSYLAIARGEVPPRHWRRLSRAIVRRGRYTGMASWSGTMFEYLMPQLLLPDCGDSLLGESLLFCVDQQRRWGAEQGIVWGVSESGFYALDPGQNFQYKAHGVPGLTVKNEADGERVIAPYASFLALMSAPAAAAANLRRIRSLGAEGIYGLYEALDFTPLRGGSREQPLLVRSWMAHHLGMSLLAVDNCLMDAPMVSRFLRDVSMNAARELLQEKIPVGEGAVRRGSSLRIPPPRRRAVHWHRSGSGFDREDPVWGIAANDGYCVRVSADGAGPSRAGCWTILHRSGVSLSLRTEDKTIPVFPSTGGAPLHWDYRSGCITLRWQGDGLGLEQRIQVDDIHMGERRSITLRAKAGWEGTLCLLLRPVLDRWDSYAAHPAFSRMCVESQYLGCGVRFVRRRGRGGLAPVLTLLWDRQEAGWSTNRERLLSTGSVVHENREGTVLDPCVALELPVVLSPGESCSLAIALAVGGEEDSRTAAQALLGQRRPVCSPLTDQLATAHGAACMDAAMALLSRLECPGTLGREGTVGGQESLWPYSISGDLPLVTCQVVPEQWGQSLFLAGVHHCLTRLGYPFDLILLLPAGGDYLQSRQNSLRRVLERAGHGPALDRDGGIRLLCLSQQERAPILGMAAVNLRPGDRLEQENTFPTAAGSPLPSSWEGDSVQWRWLSRGFLLETGGGLPPLRWSHLLVNARFGWRCDETGGGHLWYRNAHLGQLTPWRNDPVAESGPEELKLCTGAGVYSLFAARDGCPVSVTYGPGYARWEKRIAGRCVTLTAFVPSQDALRVWRVEWTDPQPEDRLCWTLEPCLSASDRHRHWVRMAEQGNGVVLDNPAGTLPEVRLGLSSSVPPLKAQWRHGRVQLTFPARENLLLLAGVEGAYSLSPTLPAVASAMAECVDWWTQRTAALTFHTPDEALNHYLSFWGTYQVLAGRVLGRNGLYQCGGAVGFRDQLQDVLALLPFCPEVAKAAIAAAAGHQFREGDVLHWWHPDGTPESALGVRTRISDDLLWLPYALCRWVEELGDTDLLRTQAPWLEGDVLAQEERERYCRWNVSSQRDTLYRHGVQAVECVLNRGLGVHGLCRMGTGDWNDGLNRIGAKGRGESVWLSWFCAIVLRRFALLCAAMGEPERQVRYQRLGDALAQQADRAWDEAWYLRAWDDAGAPVGAKGNDECAIDSVAQSFAVFALGPEPRPRQAVHSAVELLWDREHALVRLLWPPFHNHSDPGYLTAYPEGLRENGGQYTHAACWLAMALLRCGETDTGAELLHDLLPEHHPNDTYRAEPYVLAGDVYAARGQQGRGGWSWYTGSAGWYCQTALRELLGIRMEGGRLHLRPRLPSDWEGYQARWQGRGWILDIRVSRGEEQTLLLDGMPAQEGIDLSRLTGGHRLELQVPYSAPESGRCGCAMGSDAV